MTRFLETAITIPTGTYARQTFLQMRRGSRQLHVAVVAEVRGADRYTIFPARVIAETCGDVTVDSMPAARRHVTAALVAIGYASPPRNAPHGA
jgi:hypothetical protein